MVDVIFFLGFIALSALVGNWFGSMFGDPELRTAAGAIIGAIIGATVIIRKRRRFSGTKKVFPGGPVETSKEIFERTTDEIVRGLVFRSGISGGRAEFVAEEDARRKLRERFEANLNFLLEKYPGQFVLLQDDRMEVSEDPEALVASVDQAKPFLMRHLEKKL